MNRVTRRTQNALLRPQCQHQCVPHCSQCMASHPPLRSVGAWQPGHACVTRAIVADVAASRARDASKAAHARSSSAGWLAPWRKQKRPEHELHSMACDAAEPPTAKPSQPARGQGAALVSVSSVCARRSTRCKSGAHCMRDVRGMRSRHSKQSGRMRERTNTSAVLRTDARQTRSPQGRRTPPDER